MEGWTIAVSVLGAVGTVCAIIFGYLAFTRGKSKDSTETGEKTGTILTELGYIKANTDEIKAEQKDQRKINMEIYSRLSTVEASAKQAHKRIDEFIGHAKDD